MVDRPINGTSPSIYELNATSPLNMEDGDTALAYLRFFCNAVRGEEGPFRILEELDQLPLDQPATGSLAQELSAEIRPVQIGPADADHWPAQAVVQYDYGLFAADFKIMRTGMVEMLDDRPLRSLEGVRHERIHCGLRYFDGVFAAKEALSDKKEDAEDSG